MMSIIYKSTYIWNVLTTLFMEVCNYSVQLVPKFLNAMLPFLILKTFSLRKAFLRIQVINSLQQLYLVSIMFINAFTLQVVFLYWDVMVHYIQLSRSSHISYLYLIGLKRVWTFGVYIFPEVTSWMAVQIPGGSVGCHGARCKGAELSQPHAEGIKNENEKD